MVKTPKMSIAGFTVITLALFAQSYAAPKPCGTCTSYSSYDQNTLSQRSARLEDLDEPSTLNLGTQAINLADNRPGNWTDEKRYKTNDGHGEVLETQGQIDTGNGRVRYFKRKFVSGFQAGNLAGVATPDLRGYDYDRRDDSQRVQSTYDQSTRFGSDHAVEGSSRSWENSNSRRDRYNDDRYTGVNQVQDSAYDQSITRGNTHATRDSVTRGSSYGRLDAERYSSHGAGAGQDRLINVDQSNRRNWSEVDQYRTDGGLGQVYEERGQYTTGPKQVHYFKQNYTSSYSSGDELGLSRTRDFAELEREAQQRLQSALRTVENSGNDRTHSYRGSETYNQPERSTQQTYERTGSYRVSRPMVSVHRTEEENRLTQGYRYPSSSRDQYSDDEQRTQGTITYGDAGSRRTSSGQYADRSTYNQRLQNGQYEQSSGRVFGTVRPTESQHFESLSSTRHSDRTRSGHAGSHQEAVRGEDWNRGTYGSTRGTIEQQTTTGHSGNAFATQNGRLVVSGVELGPVAGDADCSQGTGGQISQSSQSSYDTYQRIYKRDDNQQNEDLTQQFQQSEDLTQQNQDLTQQFQNVEDMSQQTSGQFDFGSQHTQKPSRLELGSQRTEDLTQQTSGQFDFGSQHTQQSSGFELGSQKSEDLTQQFQNGEDMSQQTSGQFDFGSQHTQKPSRLELGSQRTEDLTQQTSGQFDFGSQHTQQSNGFELGSQKSEDLTQQFQNVEDMSQQTSGQFDFGSQHTQKPSRLELGSQRTEDLTQQFQRSEDLVQQTTGHFDLDSQFTQKPSKFELDSQLQQDQDRTQQFQNVEELAQQTTGHFDLGSQRTQEYGQLEFGGQQTEDLTHQNEDLTQQFQQSEDFDQQTTGQFNFGSQHTQQLGEFEFGGLQTEDLTQQNEDLTQQFENPDDFTQQTTGSLDVGGSPIDYRQQASQNNQFPQFIESHDLHQRPSRPSKPAPKPKPFRRRQSQHVQQVTLESAAPVQPHVNKPSQENFAQQNHQHWKQTAVYQTAQTSIVPSSTDERMTTTTESLIPETIDFSTEFIPEDEKPQISRGDQAPPRDSKPYLHVTSTTASPVQVEQITPKEWIPFQNHGRPHVPQRPGHQWHYNHHPGDLTNSEGPVPKDYDQTNGHDQHNLHVEDSQQRNDKSAFEQQNVSDVEQHTGKTQFGELSQTPDDLQQSSNLEIGQESDDFQHQSGQIHLSQQTEDFQQQSGQFEFGQQTDDQQQSGRLELGQKTVDQQQSSNLELGGESDNFEQQSGKLEFGQQTDDFQQHSGKLEVGQQTVDQQQSSNLELGGEPDNFEQQSGKLEFGQQTDDFQQYSGKLEVGQQTVDHQQSSNLELGGEPDNFEQQSGKLEFGQQTDDFQQYSGKLEVGQQTVDHQQSSHLELGGEPDNFEQQSGKLEFGQQTDDFHQNSGKLEVGQQTVDHQQSSNLELGREPDNFEQQSGKLEFGQQTDDFQQHSGKLEVDQQTVDQQQSSNLELGGEPDNFEQQSGKLEFGQQTDDFQQQSGKLEFDPQNDVVQKTSIPQLDKTPDDFQQKSGKIEFGQQGEDLQIQASSMMESKQESTDNAKNAIQFQPRILEAYGGSVDHNANYEDAKLNPSATLAPEDGSDPWDIWAYPNSFNGRSMPDPTTTTTTTPPPTTLEPTTEAPSFWGRVGNKITSGYDKAKEKAKQLFG